MSSSNENKFQTNDSFEKMNDVFDTEFDGSIIENKLTEIEKIKSEANALIENKDNIAFEDKGYLQLELKQIIQTTMHVLEICRENIKIGSSARDKEVFFNGVGKMVEACKELRELNRVVTELNIQDKKSKTPANNVTVKMDMSSRDMLKYLNKLEAAQKNNKLNEVSAEFQIDKDNK